MIIKIPDKNNRNMAKTIVKCTGMTLVRHQNNHLMTKMTVPCDQNDQIGQTDIEMTVI